MFSGKTTNLNHAESVARELWDLPSDTAIIPRTAITAEDMQAVEYLEHRVYGRFGLVYVPEWGKVIYSVKD